MHFESFKEAVDFAVEKEKEAASFYDQASEEEALSGSKQMFKEFAEEERKHQRMLENLDSVDVRDFQPKGIQNLKRSDYMDDFEYKKGMGYRDILTIAMKREEKALALYQELEKQAEKENMKKLFKLLAEEEAKHKLGLETLYDDFMAKMGD